MINLLIRQKILLIPAIIILTSIFLAIPVAFLANNTLNKRLLLNLSFNDTGVINDKSSKNWQAIIHGNPEWVPGKQGQAIKLDGEQDYIEIKDSNEAFEEGDFTFTFWKKFNGQRLDTQQYVLDHYNWSFFRSSGEWLTFHVGRMNNRIDGPTYQLPTLLKPNNEWYFIAGTYNPSKGKILLYINGKKIDQKKINDAKIATNYGKQNLLIGNSTHGLNTQNNHYNGYIDEVKIYNKALNDHEIKSLYYGVNAFLLSQTMKYTIVLLMTSIIFLSAWYIYKKV